jgi:hypothetical protein
MGRGRVHSQQGCGEDSRRRFSRHVSRGNRYTKSEEVADTSDLSKTARDCRLIDAKVRFFGDDLAMVYVQRFEERKMESGNLDA